MASTTSLIPSNPQQSITLAMPSPQTDIKTTLNDPFGHGFEGRIAVDRAASTRRKGIVAVLAQYAARGMQAPATVQYNYFLTHGFYTAEELKEHPGRPKDKPEAEKKCRDWEEEARIAAEQAAHIESLDKADWERRTKRLNRWGVLRAEKQRKEQERRWNGPRDVTPPDSRGTPREEDDDVSDVEEVRVVSDTAFGSWAEDARHNVALGPGMEVETTVVGAWAEDATGGRGSGRGTRGGRGGGYDSGRGRGRIDTMW